jgi:hypothetical protein
MKISFGISRRDARIQTKKTKPVALSPQANYTDWATAVAGEASADFFE